MSKKNPDLSPGIELEPEPRFVEVEPESKSESDEVMEKIQEILKEHDYQEPNIGLNNDYWALKNIYRGLQKG